MLEMPRAATAIVTQTMGRRRAPSSWPTDPPARAGSRGTQNQIAEPGAEADARDGQVQGLPARVLADEGPERGAEDGGDGQAGHHRRERLAALARAVGVGGHDGSGPEVGALDGAGDEARRDEHPEVAAAAESRLPTTNSTTRARSSVRRLSRAAPMVRIGEPMTTPSAYAVTAYVATGTETSRSAASSWMIPLLPNSPVPMANVPRASESRMSMGAGPVIRV